MDLYSKGYDFEKFMHLNNGDYVDKVQEFLQLSSDALTDALKEEIVNIECGKVLVFGEVWCPDCVINMTALEVISRCNRRIEYSIVPREGNEEALRALTPDGSSRIPTFVALDADGTPKGFFLEKPQVVKTVEAGDDQVKRIVVKRDYRNGKYLADTIKEIVEML